MNKKTRLISFFLLSGFFVCLDQFFKYKAQAAPTFSYHIASWLGWEYFANPGIAFSIPFPSFLLLLLTPLIIILLVHTMVKQTGRPWYFFLALFLIIGGALSNFIDRVLFGITIDYLRLFNGVINMADMMIVAGGLLLVMYEIKKTISFSSSR